MTGKVCSLVPTRICALVLVPLSGCSNRPGDLTLEIHSTKSEYVIGECIEIDAVLRTSNRPVCLSKHREFSVRIQHREDGVDCLNTIDDPVLYCGTGIVESILIFPWMWAGAWLDIADVLARFEVMPARRELSQRIEFHSPRKFPRRHAPNSAAPDHDHLLLKALSEGTYDVTFVLNNRRGFCADFLPPPLGWKLYDQRVEASTTICVRQGLKDVGSKDLNKSMRYETRSP